MPLSFFAVTTRDFGRELYVTDGTSEGTRLVKDIISGPVSSNPDNFILLGDLVFFTTTGFAGIRGLWVTDGTSSGTIELADEIIGFGSNNSPAILNGKIFFGVNNGVNGRELWTSDGTSGGTFFLADIPENVKFSDVILVGNLALFQIFNNRTSLREVWVSDGTAEGTRLVADISGESIYTALDDAVVAGGNLFFRTVGVSSSTTNVFLYDSLTGDVASLKPEFNFSSVTGSVDFGGSVLFSARIAGGAVELWISDGTVEGTQNFVDAFPGAYDFVERVSFHNGNYFWYNAITVLENGDKEYAVWVSDGTSSGTQELGPGKIEQFLDTRVEELADGRFLFLTTDAGTPTLWVTDGTVAGTQDLATLPPFGDFLYFLSSSRIGDHILFTADTAAGEEIWHTDGTVAGTARIIDAGTGHTFIPANIGQVGAVVVFELRTTDAGREAWVSDGTAAGTHLLADLMPGTGNGAPRAFFTFGENLLFIAASPDVGTELWITDGTESGTELLKDIRVGVGSSVPFEFTLLGDKVLFVANDLFHGRELWVTDGTTAGTFMLKDVAVGRGSSSPRVFEIIDGLAYFSTDSDAQGSELWVTDGTVAGTTLVSVDVGQTPTGDGLVEGSSVYTVGNNLFLKATDGTNSVGIYVTNADGSALLTEVFSHPDQNFVHFMGAIDGSLIFSAYTTELGEELWISDGTVSGTHLLLDINPGEIGSQPKIYNANLDGLIIFSAFDSTHGPEIWVTDGTTAGTQLLIDTFAGIDEYAPSPLSTFSIGNKFVFQAESDVYGTELFVTDGTPEGTMLLVDIEPTSETFIRAIGSAATFEEYAGFVYFTASGGGIIHNDLWRTDGTPEGTMLLIDEPTDSDAEVIIRGMHDNILLYSHEGEPGQINSLTAYNVLTGEQVVLTGGVSGRPAYASSIYIDGEPANANGYHVFRVFDSGTNSVQLWATDGSFSGTHIVSDLNFSGAVLVSGLSVINGRLLMKATIRTADFRTEQHLLSIDGTETGTIDIDPGTNYFSNNNLIWYTKVDGLSGDIWVTDGTQAGTFMVANTVPGGHQILNTQFKSFGDKVVIEVKDEDGNIELFSSDGTVGNMVALLDEPSPSVLISYYQSTDTHFYFGIDSQSSGREFWVTDGTKEGTHVVADINQVATSIGFNPFDFLVTTIEAPSGPTFTEGSDDETGTPNDDVLNALGGNDIVHGGDGNDTINGGTGNDQLFGDAGDDTLNGGDGDDTLIGGAGADGLTGGAGYDTADYRSATAGVGINTASQGTNGEAFQDTYLSIERLFGSNFNDVIQGSIANEDFFGEGGDDTINGGGGDDNLFGGDGDDTLIGVSGVDSYDGGAGIDTIDFNVHANLVLDLTAGTAGIGATTENFVNIERFELGSNATVIGNAGDFILISDGTGILDLSAASSGVIVTALTSSIPQDYQISGFSTIHGSAFADTLTGNTDNETISGGDGNDRLDGGAGDDILDGGAGADTLLGGAGEDVMNGGAGLDSADYRASTSRITLDMTTSGTLGDAAGDTYSSIERVFGTDFNDRITGTAANEFLFGGDGNDIINGGDGIDRIYGGDGNDVQRGEGGSDTLYGSAGADQLNGGIGNDIANYSLATASVSVIMSSGGTAGDAAGDTYFGIESVYGSDFNDILIGNNSVNELRGGDGDDILSGSGGNDRLFGEAGADSMNGGVGADVAMYTNATSAITLNLATGGTVGDAAGDSYSSVEWVFATDFADTITGDTANNRLEGRLGNDVLNGAAGNDRLLGGDGNDVINGGDGIDTILGQIGDDIINGGAGNDFMIASSGSDTFDGGSEFDTVNYLASSAGVTVNLQTGGTGGDATGDTYTNIERVFGSQHDDVIDGSDNADTLLGNGGADLLRGGLGNDRLIGGAGDDSYVFDTTQDGADVFIGYRAGAAGAETIYVTGGDMAFDTFAEVMTATTQVGANAVIDFGGGNRITLIGVTLGNLDTNDFTFTPPPAGEALGEKLIVSEDLGVVDDNQNSALTDVVHVHIEKAIISEDLGVIDDVLGDQQINQELVAEFLANAVQTIEPIIYTDINGMLAIAPEYDAYHGDYWELT